MMDYHEREETGVIVGALITPLCACINVGGCLCMCLLCLWQAGFRSLSTSERSRQRHQPIKPFKIQFFMLAMDS